VVAFFNAEGSVGVPRTLVAPVTSLHRALLTREAASAKGSPWEDDCVTSWAHLVDGFIQSPEYRARRQRLFRHR
jgi:hypothetical protein